MKKFLLCFSIAITLCLAACANTKLESQLETGSESQLKIGNELTVNYINLQTRSGFYKFISKAFPDNVVIVDNMELNGYVNNYIPENKEITDKFFQVPGFIFDDKNNYILVIDEEDVDLMNEKLSLFNESAGTLKFKIKEILPYTCKTVYNTRMNKGYPSWVVNPLYYSGGFVYEELPVSFIKKVIKIAANSFEIIS